jgi:tricorn protease
MRLLHLFTVTFSLILAFSIAAIAGDDAIGMLFPAISPDGSQIAFSYQGDIWTVPAVGGNARRLTVSIAFDRSPVWSPDGTQLLFASQRDGNYDLYVMPATGGEPKRLTYSDADDYPSDWSPDGKRVLFTTYRDFPGNSILELNLETGRERVILRDSATLRYPRYSPDGKRIAFNRGGSSYTRIGYLGSNNSQVWVMDKDGMNARRLDMWDGGQYWPCWSDDGKSLYYLTDRKGARCVFAVNVEGGEPHAVAEVQGKDLYYLSVSSGKDAVVWADGLLYSVKLNVSGQQTGAKSIPIQAGSDTKLQYTAREVFNTADEVEPSPDGKWLALAIRGDIYIQPLTRTPEQEADAPRGGEAVNFTNTPGRETGVIWLPGSDKIILLSDKDGDQSIYEIDLNTREWTRLTKAREIDANPRLSPDGKQVAFFRDNDLYILNLETKREYLLKHGTFRSAVWTMSLEWSPDSKWLAYNDYTVGWDTDIYLIKADGSGEAQNISQYPCSNWGPLWTADAKNLLFSSSREGDVSQLYRLPLKLPELTFTDEMKFGKPEESEQKPESSKDESAKPEDTKSAQTAETPDKEKKDTPVQVTIDFRDIEYRAKRISDSLGGIDNYVVSPDGKTCLYITVNGPGDSRIWAVDLLSGQSSSIGIGGLKWLTWNTGGAFGITSDGRVVRINLNGSQVQGTSGVPVTARTMLNRPAELLAMYDEAYRNLKFGFYDPKMHGRDMDSAYRKYRRMVQNAVTHEEFDVFTTFLLGELNASHLGVYGESSFRGIGATIGAFGVKYDESYDGPGVKVSRVFAMSPAERDESRLNVGDVILAVDGVDVAAGEMFFKQLDGKIAQTVRLRVQRADGKVDEVRIRPISRGDQLNLEYEQWVRDNRAFVEKVSGGRIGYIHIDSMMEPNLFRFQRELFGYAMKYDGLIIDVRYNGGGRIHEDLFQTLSKRQFGWATRRGTGKLPQPAEMFHGKMVCLTNEYSFSDAEIFPYGFRYLGLGKLVGMPTSGGVIGTSDYKLLDGTTFRIPQTGWFRMDGSNMENSPTVPDYFVDIAPGVMATGDDPQLRKAVEVLLSELAKKG